MSASVPVAIATSTSVVPSIGRATTPRSAPVMPRACSTINSRTPDSSTPDSRLAVISEFASSHRCLDRASW